MRSIVRKVQQTIEAHGLIDHTDRLIVGVSGGADSVCLLLVLRKLGYDTSAAHLNHGLRGTAADEDEAFTRNLADRLGVRFFSKKVPVSEQAGNTEAAGREARRAFFRELQTKHGFTKIALAHTRDDRVETFVMNLLRGAGTEGLVSMGPVAGSIIRPLIGTRRAELEEYLAGQEQEWCRDATNLDLRFVRNRLRHQTIPRLAADFNPNLVETLSRSVEILEDEDAWIRSVAAQWLAEYGRHEGEDFVIKAAALHSVPAGLARRVLRAALREAGSTLENVQFEKIESARALAGPGKSGKRVEITGGFAVEREFDRLVVRVEDATTADYDYELTIPGSVHIPELHRVFTARIVEKEGTLPASQSVFVDAAAIGPRVRIRNWNPGDYYKPVGLPGGKLKKLFQRARIPRSRRLSWPVFVADSTIVWVASFPVSREFAPCARSQKLVAFEALPSYGGF